MQFNGQSDWQKMKWDISTYIHAICKYVCTDAASQLKMKPILCFLSKFRHDLPTACAPRLSRADAEMAVGSLARGRM
jgi:hypothetical protein